MNDERLGNEGDGFAEEARVVRITWLPLQRSQQLATTMP
jgi:hypothetical protein